MNKVDPSGKVDMSWFNNLSRDNKLRIGIGGGGAMLVLGGDLLRHVTAPSGILFMAIGAACILGVVISLMDM